MDEVTITLISKMVAEIGFPITIALALLYQNTKNNDVLKEMNKSIDNLTLLINEMRRDREK